MMYKIVSRGVKRLSDGAFIPNDPHNRDWREYQAWLAKDNVPVAADPPAPPPPPSLRDELADLKARVAALEAARR